MAAKRITKPDHVNHRHTHHSLPKILIHAIVLAAILAGCCFDYSAAHTQVTKASVQAGTKVSPDQLPTVPKAAEPKTKQEDIDNDAIKQEEGPIEPNQSSLTNNNKQAKNEFDKPADSTVNSEPQTKPKQTKDNEPKPKSPVTGCTVNRTSVEMFCQLGEQTPLTKHVEQQMQQILRQFDEKNDNLILDDFKEARMDRRIGATISQVIKRFFHLNFCTVVSRVMRSVMKQESDEVKMPIQKVTSMNEHITRLLADLARTKSSKSFEKRTLLVMQSLVHGLAGAGQEALSHLKALERSLLATQHGNTNNELSYIRTLVLVNLVDMFFNESVMRKSVAIPASVDGLTMDECFDSKTRSLHNKPELEVICAFQFLFNSSMDLKELIAANFKREEERSNRALAAQHSSGLVPSMSRACSNPRTSDPDHAIMTQVSCKLRDMVVNHHECTNLHGVSQDHPNDCLKHQIETIIPSEFQNKLKRALESGGPQALLYSLKTWCHDGSAFIVLSAMDVGTYFQNVLKIILGKAVSPKDQVKPTKIGTTTPVPVTTVAPPRIPESIRQEYIIQSIIVYFLRAAEQRLQCSIKPVIG